MTIPGTGTEGVEPRDRIDRYLQANGLDGPGTGVVPLTGDASDRRYFRIIRPDGQSLSCSRCTPARSISRRCRSPTSPSCCGRCRCRSRRSSDTPTRSGILALEDLGDVTLQAHLGAATPAEHAALYRQAVALIELLQRRGARARIPAAISRTGSRSTSRSSRGSSTSSSSTSSRAIAARRSPPRERAALAEEWSAIVDRAGGRAARALPSRLSQPQPDAARGQPVHHRLPGRAHGAGHLRSRVAAARLLRRPDRSRRRRADRVLSGAQGADRRLRRSSSAAAST